MTGIENEQETQRLRNGWSVSETAGIQRENVKLFLHLQYVFEAQEPL